MKRFFLCLVALAALVWTEAPARAQSASAEAMRRGANFLSSSAYTAETDEALLKLFRGLRVADVSDGMDRAGLPGTGLVDPAIHALWTDTKDFSHRICGIAVTVRYVPAQVPVLPSRMDGFAAWEGAWYDSLSSEAWTKLVRPGSVVVIDDAEGLDVGTIGSFNSLAWKKAGAAGVVTDGGCRDVDEVAAERVPVYLRRLSRGIRPGRNVLESVNRPVDIGGVCVRPGDVVVADGDGVVVVPRAVAAEVAEHARGILDGDKAGRRALYESLGLPVDASVR